MHAELRSDDDDRTSVEQSPGGGDEGAGFPEGDLGQSSLTSCCLKLDTRAPLLPSTWIAYLMHTHQQLMTPTLSRFRPYCAVQVCKQPSVLGNAMFCTTHKVVLRLAYKMPATRWQ